MLRNSTGPWSPWIISGPGSPSLASSAPPVGPAITGSATTVRPLSTTVTRRPTSVISYVCHSPGASAAFSFGVTTP